MRLSAIRRPSPVSFFLYLAGFALLVVTAAMNRHAGVSQGATEEGRQLLGAGAIIIDIVGLVIFGSVVGYLYAAGKKVLGTLVLVVVVGCALFSISSIMSFVANEWLSVAESRRTAVQSAKETRAAQIAAQELAAKERRELQAKLAAQHLKTLEGTNLGKGAGRQEKRELRKDMNTAAADLIAKVGQADPVAAPQAQNLPPAEITLRPDGGSEIMGWMASLPERTVQVTRMAALAILLIVLKAFAFPLGAYFWGRKTAEELRTFDLPSSPPPTEPAKLETAKPLALPKPTAVAEPIALRAEPSPEWRALLDQIDFPRKKPLGALRPRDAREAVGWRWFVWICAFNRTGVFTTDEMTRMYDEFSGADHREQWGVKHAKGELSSAARKFIQVRDSRSPATWTVAAMPLDRLRDRLIKYKVIPPHKPKDVAQAAPSEPEVAEGRIVPFSGGASSAAPPAREPQKASSGPRRALQGLAEMSRHFPDLEGLRRLERRNKAFWQAKMLTPHRKQLNRFSRARAAA